MRAIIDHTKIDSPLADFQIFIPTQGSVYQNGVPCWAESTRRGLWVKVPSISNTIDTILDIAPANSYTGATGTEAAKNVWPDFVSVWHLDSLKDSTLKHDLTAPKPPALADWGMVFDGIDDYLETPDHDDFSVITTNALEVSACISPNVADFPTGNPYIRWMGKGNNSAQQEWQFVMYNQSYTSRPHWISFYNYGPSGGQGAGDYSTGIVPVNSWLQVIGNSQATSPTNGIEYIYRNGTQHTGNPDSWQKYGFTYQNGTAPVRIGMQYAGGGNFSGRIADVKISNKTRSAAWRKADYYSTMNQLVRLEGDMNELQVTMTSNTTKTASFKKKSYTLTVNTAGDGTGTVTKSPDKSAYAPGEVVTLTPVAAVDSDFIGWT